ncbi:hypothetical protein D9M68_821630 [compost metagenome]
MDEATGLALLDYQRADQAAPQLMGAGQVRVVPETARVLGLEAVVEILAGQHRQLRHIGHAVHFQGQADAVPMDCGGLVELVDEAHPQPVALARAQLHARRLAAIGPGLRGVARDQFEIERRGDQLKVVGPGIQRAAEPVTGTAGTEADHAQAGQAAENLSASERHGVRLL